MEGGEIFVNLQGDKMVGSTEAAKKRKRSSVAMKEADKSISPKVLQIAGKSKAKKTGIEEKATAKLSPSYSKMDVEAIAALSQTTGSRRQDISKFIKDKFEVPADLNEILRKDLMSLTVEGIIVQASGSFILPAKNPEKEKPKKAPAKIPTKKNVDLKEEGKNIMAAAHSVDKERSGRRGPMSADTEVNCSTPAASTGTLVKCSTPAASARKSLRLKAMGEEKLADNKRGSK